ncbi:MULTISPECIES: hypothetical protein [Serratia]|uniref:hypothetical protein n=1 Tax=Serratia TaxID=613 RepID=UPI0016600B63|nr:hypothetical protein [Serratia marcescens]HAT4978869.1 hypothetical protein [Serratia marcescens]HBB7109458.1 hypothetical protein [Serratia marcescens]HBC2511414.1 hypothetical protein [Serratia marcescens]HBC2523618.1 hypothetical protein [Serratia marcescens]HBC2527943.1 hypothetical protein [Serratia marcescens]
MKERPVMQQQVKYPGDFDSLEIRKLLDGLVSAHISSAIAGEKMKTADRNRDLATIKESIVSAAHLVRSIIEEREGVWLIGSNAAETYESEVRDARK